MKRILFALGVGVALFAVVAFAAGLLVDGGGLQSGSGDVVCDTDGVGVTYQDTDSNGSYDQATVSGIGCPGTLRVTVEIHNGAEAILATGTNTSSGVSILVGFSNVLESGEIGAAHHVHVTIVTTGP